MSFVTSIRDYVETLNTISDNLKHDLTITRFVSETSIYFLKTLQVAFFYIIRFQWVRDFTLLPIVLPKLSASIFKETFFLETPSQVFFDFLEIPDLHQNKFLLGFFNSFFLSLPISVVYIVSIRRLLIQGIPAGVYSIGGYLIGQILFLSCTIFGLRQFLVPWLTVEPLSYILGLILIFRIIYSMTRENLTELKGWFSPEYKTFFLTSFLLAWCEQSSIFQYLGNLTASSNVTILETFSSSSPISSFVTHFFYIFGIITGSLVFTFFWGIFFLQLKNWCILYTPIFISSFIQFINKTSFVLALAFSLTSIPFYGLDYLATGPLGFVSQDNLFKNTVFDQRNEKLEAVDPRLSDLETNYKFIHIDVSPFDRGEYLLYSEGAQPLSFEDLNYRGEFDWTGRSNNQGLADSRSSFFSLSKILKKQNKNPLDFSLQGEVVKTKDRNILLSEKDASFDPIDFEMDHNSLDRFQKDYDLPITDLEEDIFLKPYREIYNTSFPVDYFRGESTIEKDIEQKIKEKYYSNPIYKGLLALDIDLFLKRQPEKFQLQAEQEQTLYTKRRILESYYNSLRDYSQLPYNETFETFFDGAKSFSNKVYNQQFKGTLRSVRRLFSLTINANSDSTIQTVLKFDQPLYELSEKQQFSPYHEELEKQKTPSNLLYKSDLVNKPLYAGWDENLRKFVITNKLLPRKFAGYQVISEPEITKSFSQNSTKQGRKIKFTTWPLSQKALANKKITYVTLFESLDQKTRDALDPQFVELDTLPPNLERFKRTLIQKGESQQAQDIFESLAPKRGGFIWPGNSNFQFPFISK
jgi:hypothetical protein